MLWHPKFYLDFSKKIVWLEGGDLNFSSKEPSLSKYFFWQELYLDSPKTWCWSWRFFLFIWTQTKMLVTWEKCLLKIPLKMPYGFWNDPLPLSKKSLLPWHKCRSPLISLSSSLDHDILQIQQFEPPHNLFSFYFLSQMISAFYSSSWRFTKELPFLFWFLSPNQFP